MRTVAPTTPASDMTATQIQIARTTPEPARIRAKMIPTEIMASQIDVLRVARSARDKEPAGFSEFGSSCRVPDAFALVRHVVILFGST
jgi:hypothetical protein